MRHDQSTGESFNDWGGRGCRKIVPVSRGDGAKTDPPGDIFDQPPGGLSLTRGKLADHVEDHSPIPGRDCFGEHLGDRIDVCPPPPIVERLWTEACCMHPIDLL